MANAEKKKTKREQKAAKRAAREAARRAERRRALLTAGIVGVVLLVGTALVALTIVQERDAEAQAEQEALEAASEAARQASEAAEELANRDVACGADVPATATTDDADATRPTFDEPAQVLEDGVDYRATVVTSCGELTMDLAEEEAPETVNSFVFLAREGFFAGLEIFRNATSIGALQTGAGSNNASWQIGYTLPDELVLAEAEGYPAGAVAMANAGPDTGGSQFFFVYNDQFGLDPTFTRFAQVTEGLDVLEEIGAIETIGPAGETPGQVVYIDSVEITEAEATDEPTDDTGDTGDQPAEDEPVGEEPSED